ncbi:helix-turn-helix domain-containing protein [Pirellula sp. SH-Sr6A]|uniref:helix-turn-helix domain-containing protein n=1 Tax=Pirellula sp. SH-Sr6A TaxID=1632865 RepID=UPI00197C242A|nr:helix-turn-helix domain-containing protein [Pirellula sp. SH-Sr6A]
MTRLDDLPDVLTPKQVAEYLQISHDAVRALLRSGRLRGVNAGAKQSKYWRITKEAIREFTSTTEPAQGMKKPNKSSVVKTYF